MSDISLLAVMTCGPDDDAVAGATCDLVRRLDTIGTFLVAVPLMYPATAPLGMNGLMSPLTWEAIETSYQAHVALACASIETAAQEAGLALGGELKVPSVCIAQDAASPWLSLRRESPLADLVVTGRSSVQGDGPWTGVLADLLMTGKAPVMLVSETHTSAGGAATIAWNGSLEAGWAVRAAADPRRLKHYLQRHRIPGTETVGLSGAKPGAALLHEAQRRHVSRLVAGSFGHARLPEAVVGGATRTLLDASDGQSARQPLSHAEMAARLPTAPGRRTSSPVALEAFLRVAPDQAAAALRYGLAGLASREAAARLTPPSTTTSATSATSSTVRPTRRAGPPRWLLGAQPWPDAWLALGLLRLDGDKSTSA